MRDRMVVILMVVFVTLLMTIPVAQTQDADETEVVIFVAEDTLVVYVAANGIVSMQGFTFASVINGDPQTFVLQDYPNFALPSFEQIPTPVCFVLAEVNANNPLPQVCNNATVIRQIINAADNFWFDRSGNQTRTFAIGNEDTQIALCGAGQTRCDVDFIPSSVTPTPTPRPTNTPVPPTFTPTPTITPRPTDTPGPLQAAFTPVARNADWTPQVVTFDDDPAGAEMVVVPVGSFEMGSPTNEQGRDSDEEPHPQQVTTPYFIDRYEITNAQFAAFLNDSAEARDNRSHDNFEYIDTDDEHARIRLNGDKWEVIPGYENHSVTEVTWFGARDFCAGRGMSLPTELQWEYAARGPDSLVYPWGNDFVANNVVYSLNSDNQTAPVGSRPGGASWVGALDMSGNVWEWLSSLYEDYPYSDDHESNRDTSGARVLRGGSFLNSTSILRSANRLRDNPGIVNLNYGFRCARSY